MSLWHIVQLNLASSATRARAADALGRSRSENAAAQLGKALANKDPSVRFLAAIALGEIGDRGAIAGLTLALVDPAWWVRCGAEHALARIDTDWSSSEAARKVAPIFLAKMLSQDGGENRVSALLPFIQVADSSYIASLVDALKNGRDRLSRVLSAQALGLMQDEGVLEPLVAVLETESNESVRMAAILALRNRGDRRAVPFLIEALSDSSKSVREVIENLLPELDPDWARSDAAAGAVSTLIDALRDSSPLTRLAAASALRVLASPRALDALIAALRDHHSEVRIHAAMALGAIGDRGAMEPLLTTLGDRNDLVRMASAAALGLLGDAKSVPALAEALRDHEGHVVETALKSLADIGGKEAVEILVGQLVAGGLGGSSLSKVSARQAAQALDTADPSWRESPAAQAAAAELAAKAGEPRFDREQLDQFGPGWRTTQAVRTRAAENRELLRTGKGGTKEAIEILGQLGDEEAIDQLLECLQDSDFLTRQAAAKALGSIGGVKAAQGLVRALTDDTKYVRQVAARALWELKEPCTTQALGRALGDRDAEVCGNVIPALRALGGEEAAQALRTGLRNGDEQVRQKTAWALGDVGTASCVEALLDALRDDRLEWSTVSVALDKISEESAVEKLRDALADPDTRVRRVVASALARLDETEVLESILEDKSKDVRVAAVSGLEKGSGGQSSLRLLALAMHDKAKEVRTAAAGALEKLEPGKS